MQKTTNYNLNLPEKGEFYNVDDFNENAEILDAKLKEVEDATKSKDADTVDGYHTSDFGLSEISKKRISDTFTFQNLCESNTVTFFTNWNDKTNFPTAYGSGVVIPCADATYKMLIYRTTTETFTASAKKQDGVWTADWDTQAITAEFAKFFPITGGTISGKTTVSTNQSIPFVTKNTSGDINMTSYNGVSGVLGYLGFNGVDNPAYMKAGVGYFPLLHTGNVGKHALPISGGTVRNHTPAPFNIDNLNAGEILSLIGYYANGAQLGLIGFYGANNPVFYSTAGAISSLHHDGNSNKIVFTEDDTTAPASDALWAHL